MPEKNENSYLSYGISFGLLGGVILGSISMLIFDTPLAMAFGPGFGMLIGIIVSTIINKNKDEQDK